MSHLSLDEKMSNAERRIRELEAEKHFYDIGQPHYPLGFSVGYRNPGHWDVYADQVPGKIAAWLAANPGASTSGNPNGSQRERAFRIRGEPGNVVVYDHRWDPHRPHPRQHMTFRSVSTAMLWIVEELMQEPKP